MREKRTCDVCGKVLAARIERVEGVHLSCQDADPS